MFDLSLYIDIQGYEGQYKISNDGFILSVERYIETKLGKKLCPTRIIIPKKDKNGLYVLLWKNGKSMKHYIDELVNEHFKENKLNETAETDNI